jgi:hypothetical protein
MWVFGSGLCVRQFSKWKKALFGHKLLTQLLKSPAAPAASKM